MTGPGTNPSSKFSIDSTTGVITTAGAMVSGDSYVILTQACDQAPASTQRLVLCEE